MLTAAQLLHCCIASAATPIFHSLAPRASPAAVLPTCYYPHEAQEFDARWLTYFSQLDIDAWEFRKPQGGLLPI
uniref:Uncharacterized protein n=1 Tax=Varanus komodoensis TaxID=61221 RepID=A0A8D2LAT7_VARKO